MKWLTFDRALTKASSLSHTILMTSWRTNCQICTHFVLLTFNLINQSLHTQQMITSSLDDLYVYQVDIIQCSWRINSWISTSFVLNVNYSSISRRRRHRRLYCHLIWVDRFFISFTNSYQFEDERFNQIFYFFHKFQ